MQRPCTSTLTDQGFLLKSTLSNSWRWVLVAPRKESTLICFKDAAKSERLCLRRIGDLRCIVCHDPPGIVSGLGVMVDNLQKQVMLEPSFVLKFLYLQLGDRPLFDALHMHWHRNCRVHIISGMILSLWNYTSLTLPVRQDLHR